MFDVVIIVSVVIVAFCIYAAVKVTYRRLTAHRLDHRFYANPARVYPY